MLRWNVWIDYSIERVLKNSGAHTPGVDNKAKKDYTTSETRERLREDVKHALRSILEPIYEGKQHPHSYGFRPYRGTHQAIERVRFLIGRLDTTGS
ncbi:hypothetical protein [Alicyclobacillus sp. SO9]|uniref:hypothetical protein n=1 Tax=Alicyclobacillus sp. SO9 TaxID=2665646 RepID=UPI0019358984|nr:hypothetical protein [Alicyclobacillus sp. SO9]QQE80001.1 hypothetical protein GI364_05885 [Alicyclobacillus sp. SO9]